MADSDAIKSTCRTCNGAIQWQECPTGGWWYHEVHPTDDHDAVGEFAPIEEIDNAGRLYTVASDPFGPPADEPDLPPAPETLTPADLRTLRAATAYSYQAGEYPPDMPDHLRAYTIPDGGLLRLLDQAIAQAELLAAPTAAELASTERPSDARLHELIAGRFAPWRMVQAMADELLKLRAYVTDHEGRCDTLCPRCGIELDHEIGNLTHAEAEAGLAALVGEPIGYAVTVAIPGGRAVQTSPLLRRDEAEIRADFYHDQDARAVELRDVVGRITPTEKA